MKFLVLDLVRVRLLLMLLTMFLLLAPVLPALPVLLMPHAPLKLVLMLLVLPSHFHMRSSWNHSKLRRRSLSGILQVQEFAMHEAQ